MKLKNNFLYNNLKHVYYFALENLYKKRGIPIVINGYKFQFYPRHYRWYPEDYEKASFEYIRKYIPYGSICIDIGAHFGLFSIILAKYYNCSVYAFEPTPYSASIFGKNIIYNKLEDKIKVSECAISSTVGVVDFMIQRTDGSVANSLINYWHSDEEKNRIKVEVDTIDNRFLEKKYDFLKIDAEGVEYNVLVGATKSIQKYSPKILLALHPNAIKANGHNLGLIWDWIVQEGYTCLNRGIEINKETFCAKTELFDVFLIKS